ncbi:MAG: hypothetical protein WCH29_09420 [Chitinophagaceae bacterium]
MNASLRLLLPLFITAMISALILFGCAVIWSGSAVDFRVLHGANILFFLLSAVAFQLQYGAMLNSNPQVFIRRVMLSIMLKMLVAVVAVIAYVLISGKSFNKPAVFISMLVYMLYLVVEVWLLMKQNKTKHA